MEETQNPATTPQSPKPNKASDAEVFFDVLPQLVGSFAMKHNEAVTAANLAISLARETAGQLAILGVCDQETYCTDGLPLALTQGIQPAANPSGIPRNVTQNLGNGHSRQGAMVAHFPNENTQKIQGL